MKPNLFLTVLLAGAALLPCGCDGRQPGGVETKASGENGGECKKGIENAKFENAPALGGIAVKAVMHVCKNEWKEIWDMLDSANHARIEKEMKQEKDALPGIPARIAELEGKMAAAPTEAVRKYLQMEAGLLRLKQEKLPGIDTAEDYFVFSMTRVKTGFREGMVQLFTKDGAVVAGENISPDGTGSITLKIPGNDTQVTAFHFIKEEGTWKLHLPPDEEESGQAGEHQLTEEEIAARLEGAIAAMKFENAPTFGGISRQAYTALFKKDWDFLWNGMGARDRQRFEEKMAAEKRDLAGIDARIENLRARIASPANTGAKATLGDELNKVLLTKEKLPAIENARDFFAFWSETWSWHRVEETRVEIVRDGMEVTGEEFTPDGNKGWLDVVGKITQAKYKSISFDREGGEWKFMFGMLR